MLTNKGGKEMIKQKIGIVVALVGMLLMSACDTGTTAPTATQVVGGAQEAATQVVGGVSEVATQVLPGEEMKVAFIYVGPIGDAGWTWAHDQGRLDLEKNLGVETAYQESVPENA